MYVYEYLFITCMCTSIYLLHVCVRVSIYYMYVYEYQTLEQFNFPSISLKRLDFIISETARI